MKIENLGRGHKRDRVATARVRREVAGESRDLRRMSRKEALDHWGHRDAEGRLTVGAFNDGLDLAVR